MLPERIEQLRQEYTDQYVTVEGGPPEMGQLEGRVGQVRTINMNGRAMVQFEGADNSWHDLELDYVKVVDKPEPKPEKVKKPAKPSPKDAKKKQAAKEALSNVDSADGLSRLEIARAEKEAKDKESGDKDAPAEGKSEEETK